MLLNLYFLPAYDFFFFFFDENLPLIFLIPVGKRDIYRYKDNTNVFSRFLLESDISTLLKCGNSTLK